MVDAGTFSLQLTMLNISHLFFGNSLSDFLRSSELPLPESGLVYLKSNRWIDSLAFKQNLLSSINESREYDNKILSKPLCSVKIGQTTTKFAVNKLFCNIFHSGHLSIYLNYMLNLKSQETWLHWNKRFGTFEFWMCDMMVKIRFSNLGKLEMKW